MVLNKVYEISSCEICEKMCAIVSFSPLIHLSVLIVLSGSLSLLFLLLFTSYLPSLFLLPSPLMENISLVWFHLREECVRGFMKRYLAYFYELMIGLLHGMWVCPVCDSRREGDRVCIKLWSAK